jgi:hypothetical protein
MKMKVSAGKATVEIAADAQAEILELLEELQPGLVAALKQWTSEFSAEIAEKWPRPGYKNTSKRSTGLSAASFVTAIVLDSDKIIGRISNDAKTKTGKFYAYMVRGRVTGYKNSWKVLGRDPAKSPEKTARLSALFAAIRGEK